MPRRTCLHTVLRLAAACLTLLIALGFWTPRPAMAAQTQIPPEQYEALEALYSATNGPAWINKWTLPSDTPCSLYGVTCFEGRVLWLRLDSNGLSGTLPAELGDLTGLQELRLDLNTLSGPIPLEIGNLTELRHLGLSGNALSGAIPSEIGNLTHLAVLSLTTNQLSGALPDTLGNLTDLTGLGAAYNQLSGPIPPGIGNLTALETLDLSHNMLSGSLPAGIGNLTAASAIWLEHNQLSGSLPPELGNLTALVTLDLSDNSLSGAIPAQLAGMAGLRSLDLSGNALTNTVPPEMGSMTGLTSLNVGYNRLLGPVPAAITGMSALASFNVSQNRLWTTNSLVAAFLEKFDSQWTWSQQAVRDTLSPYIWTQIGLGVIPNVSLTAWVPPGASPITATLVLMAGDAPTTAPPVMRYAVGNHLLGVYQGETPLAGFTFSTPITLTVRYANAYIAGMDESTLRLHVREDDGWVDAASTCTPASSYVRNPGINQLMVEVCHLSEFALFGQSRLWLPVVIR